MPIPLFPKRRKRKRRKRTPPPPDAQKPPHCCERYATEGITCWSCQNNEWISDPIGRQILAAFGRRMRREPPGPVYRGGVRLSRKIRKHGTQIREML